MFQWPSIAPLYFRPRRVKGQGHGSKYKHNETVTQNITKIPKCQNLLLAITPPPNTLCVKTEPLRLIWH